MAQHNKYKTLITNQNLHVHVRINVNMVLSLKPITRRQILDSSKLNKFADDNFKFDENGRKLSKQVENTVGKGEIARYEQFLLFPQCFSKACFPGASKGVLVWEWVKKVQYISSIQMRHTKIGLFSPTILQYVLKSYSPDFFLYLAAFECNTTCDWLNHTVKPIRSCVTIKFTKSWRT